ncbi:MAG: nitroreductase [Bacteriovoracaceae bacterium]|nr:nitroreductase [Bacteriovoracaceae bacterium]
MQVSQDLAGVINEREVDHEISPIFPLRWSKRAMSGELITKEELLRLFEAARWAPSSFNNQPWRFIYALRNSEDFDRFSDLLQESNRVWAKEAAVLVLIVSHKTFDKTGQPARTHSFDTGAAWENIALQASHMGFVCHGMEGFDYIQAYDELSIPRDQYVVEAMAAIGKPGNIEILPTKLKEKEHPNTRKPIEEFVFEGRFRSDNSELPPTYR